MTIATEEALAVIIDDDGAEAAFGFDLRGTWSATTTAAPGTRFIIVIKKQDAASGKISGTITCASCTSTNDVPVDGSLMGKRLTIRLGKGSQRSEPATGTVVQKGGKLSATLRGKDANGRPETLRMVLEKPAGK